MNYLLDEFFLHDVSIDSTVNVQVYGSLGHWNTAVLVILALHLLPVWGVAASLLYSLASRSPGRGPLVTSASLLLLPPALMSLATAAILAPSLGVYVEVHAGDYYYL